MTLKSLVNCFLFAALALLIVRPAWSNGEESEKSVFEGSETRVLEDGSVVEFRVDMAEVEDQEKAVCEMKKEVNHPRFLAREGEDTETTFVRIIREAYDRLSNYVTAGDREIHFELTGFETLSADQFDAVHYVDTATLPDGLLLDMTRRAFSDYGANRMSVEYVPNWKVSIARWLDLPEGKQMLTMSLHEVLSEVSKTEIEMREVEAVTRFDVRVTFEKQAREYRAAFFWLPGESSNSWRVRTLDHITQGLDVSLWDTIPPEGKPIDSEDIPVRIREKLEEGC